MWNAITEIYGRLDKAGVFNVALLLFSSIVSYQIGKALIKKFKVDFSSGQEEITFSLGLGLGVVIYATFFLGIVGLLYHWIFRLLILLVAIFFIKDILASIKRFLHYVTERKKQLKSQVLSGKFVFNLALALVLLFYIFIYLIAALAPETETDPLHYHLGALKLYRSNHRIVPVPTNCCTSYPYGMQMVYLFGWMVKDPYLAKLFHFLSGVLVVFSVYAFCKRYFSTEIGLVAGVIFYAAPLVSYESKSAFIDIGLAYATFLAIYAALNWYFTEGASDGWLHLAALFSGLAVSMKYNGINALVVVLSIVVYKCLRRGFTPRVLTSSLRRVFILLAIAFAVFCPWLIKNYVFTGNPVSPFFNKVFPNALVSPELEQDLLTVARATHCLGEATVTNYLKVIWNACTTGNCGECTGPLFLLFWPLALFVKKFDRVTRGLIYVGWALLALWVLERTTVFRYLIPALPFMSMPIAVAISHFKRVAHTPAEHHDGRKLRRPVFSIRNRQSAIGNSRAGFPFLRMAVAGLINALILGVLILQALYPLLSWNKSWYMTLYQIPLSVVWGQESRESYLSAQLDSFEVFGYINGNLPKDARILMLNSNYQFFTDRVLMDFFYSQTGRDLRDLFSALDDLRFKKVNLNVTANLGKVRWIKIKRSGLSRRCWSIHDIEVFERSKAAPGAAALPRSKWKADSNYYRLRVSAAFDPSILTYWTTEEAQRHDAYFLLDLGDFYEIEKLYYVTREPDCGAPHQLEFSHDKKNWQAIDFKMVLEDYPVHANMLTEALREIKRRGFHYIFFRVQPGGWSESLQRAMDAHAKNSELNLLFHRDNDFLYQITVDQKYD